MQRKEASNQKMQEKKPVLELKNTKKNICLEKKREFFFDADPYCLEREDKGEWEEDGKRGKKK